MPWFKVDDGLTSSRKWLSIPKKHRFEAVGVWTWAGSWAAKELMDGVIPDFMLVEWGVRKVIKDHLVSAGLWTEVDSNVCYLKWDEYQPTKAEVEAERAKNREKLRKWRDRHKGETEGVTGLQTEFEQERNPAPDPTRPDPTHISKKSIVQDKPALASEFASFWTLYPRKQGKADALKAFTAARKKTPAKTIIDGAQAYALLNIGGDKSFLKLPGGWIRGERWEDEQIVNATKHATTEQPAECPFHKGYPLPCLRCAEDGREF